MGRITRGRLLEFEKNGERSPSKSKRGERGFAEHKGYKGTAPLLRVRDSGVLFSGSEPVVTCAYQPSDSRDGRRQVAVREGGRKLRSPQCERPN